MGDSHIVHYGLFQEGMFKELAGSGWEMGWLKHTPQQCHIPSGAADGQWLPSFFSASGRNKTKTGY